tara:strand:+ start:1147 stop:1341 length:195 start_codon:yes stop_codon:yes gene_type:complete
MSRYNNDDIYNFLSEVEKEIDNLSNMVRHLHVKMDKLDKHIDFIEKTYNDLKNPIEGVKRFLGK